MAAPVARKPASFLVISKRPHSTELCRQKARPRSQSALSLHQPSFLTVVDRRRSGTPRLSSTGACSCSRKPVFGGSRSAPIGTPHNLRIHNNWNCLARIPWGPASAPMHRLQARSAGSKGIGRRVARWLVGSAHDVDPPRKLFRRHAVRLSYWAGGKHARVCGDNHAIG